MTPHLDSLKVCTNLENTYLNLNWYIKGGKYKNIFTPTFEDFIMELIKLDSGLWLCVIAKWCACIGTSMGDAIAAAKAEYMEVRDA